jgi:glucose-1-phosphate thymidylyltransferase
VVGRLAFNQGYIDRDQLEKLGVALGKSSYARYICDLAKTT